MARFAARAAAADLLQAEGAVVEHADDTAEQLRCGRCATSLVPLLGWHWFLRTADLEVAAADAIRNGGVIIDDVEARDRFVDRAERADSWCLSHQVWAGDAVPAAQCADCGQITVTAEPSSSCGACMGELVADRRRARRPLRRRAVAAGLGGLAAGRSRSPAHTIVFAGPDEITGFALPVAALGLRLAGFVPFGELVSVARRMNFDEAVAYLDDHINLEKMLVGRARHRADARAHPRTARSAR